MEDWWNTRMTITEPINACFWFLKMSYFFNGVAQYIPAIHNVQIGFVCCQNIKKTIENALLMCCMEVWCNTRMIITEPRNACFWFLKMVYYSNSVAQYITAIVSVYIGFVCCQNIQKTFVNSLLMCCMEVWWNTRMTISQPINACFWFWKMR